MFHVEHCAMGSSECSTWNIVFANLKVFHVEHFPFLWGTVGQVRYWRGQPRVEWGHPKKECANTRGHQGWGCGIMGQGSGNCLLPPAPAFSGCPHELANLDPEKPKQTQNRTDKCLPVS